MRISPNNASNVLLPEPDGPRTEAVTDADKASDAERMPPRSPG